MLLSMFVAVSVAIVIVSQSVFQVASSKEKWNISVWREKQVALSSSFFIDSDPADVFPQEIAGIKW